VIEIFTEKSKNYLKAFILCISLIFILSFIETPFASVDITKDNNYKNSLIISHKNSLNVSVIDSNNKYIGFKVSKTVNGNMKTDKNKLTSGCCSVVLQGANNSFTYAYRRDSSYSADLYIKKTKLHGKEAIKEYKLVNGYFFHTLILKDGWFIGTGGTDIPYLNRYLENLGGEIASKGKITNNDMKTAQSSLIKLGIGHFIIKSPEGNVGLSIYNRGHTKTTVFKMKKGEYVSVPNSPSHYRKGTYTVKKSNLVDAAIYIAATDKWGVNRRNIIAYDVKKVDKTTNVKIWASSDNGKYIGRTSRGWQDNIIYKGVKTKANSIPTIPNKKYIGEATLK
jgi:hypothetical protein